MTTEGTFSDVVGLSYWSESTKGTTSNEFCYKYCPGEKVTFSIGDLILGSCEGKPITTISDLIPDKISIYDSRSVNRARLLFSLSIGQGFETPIHIDRHVSQRRFIEHFLSSLPISVANSFPGRLKLL
jgi:hypothetical protein